MGSLHLTARYRLVGKLKLVCSKAKNFICACLRLARISDFLRLIQSYLVRDSVRVMIIDVKNVDPKNKKR